MQWSDEAIVLSLRPHGESAMLAMLLTQAHGRHAGLVHGGASQRVRGALQPGNLVACRWRARLAEQLGSYAVEPLADRVGALLHDPLRLAALSAACAMVEASLPEREPHPQSFAALHALLDELADDGWPAAYVRWEVGLLAETGFGLDLTQCAATGSTEDLGYVSPRSGRAVSRTAAAPYRDRLLPLPAFLRDGGPADRDAVRDGLRLTEYFFRHHVFQPQGLSIPTARERLLRRLTPATAEPAR
jgi:DNA repair protein RecO (recombination protein O)